MSIHAMRPQAQIHGVDHSEKAVCQGRLLLHTVGLDSIPYTHSSGQDIDFASHTRAGKCCIIIANFCTDKQAILSRIACTAAPGTSVLLREPAGFGALMFETVTSVSGLREPDPRQRAVQRQYFLIETRHYVVR